MAGPWEKYQQAAPAAKPWEKYGAPAVAAGPQADYGALSASTQGIGDMIPGGTYRDEAVAYTSAGLIDPIISLVTGEDKGTFDERLNRHLANQRAMRAAAIQQHPTATTVGNVGAIAAMAPKAVAGLAAPVMRSATAGERLINAGIAGVKGAAGGGAYSAVQGFGAGEGGFQPRVAEAGREAAVGIPTGAVLGAGLGAFAKMPVGVGAPSEVAQAGVRQNIDVPAAMASDDPMIQQAGGAMKSVPVFGTRVVKSANKMTEQFAGRKAQIAEGYGGGAAADAHSAGQEATDALENWAGPLTKGVLKNEYDAVDALIHPQAPPTPLQNTLFETQAIAAKNVASGLDPGGAVKFVQAALAKPGGMTYQEIKHLRTKLGEMLDNPSVIPPEINQQELKRVYGSLTRDLRASIKNSSMGSLGIAQFDKANALAAKVAKRRAELAQVLGINKPASPEAVFAAIQRKAGSRSSADIDAVNKIRKSMPPDTWDQVASGVVGGLGRSDAVSGGVSLDRFFTGYNQLSAAGKGALFGNKPDLHAALDDLATIAGRGKEVAKWANPSGTAQHGAYAALGAAVVQPWLWPKLATAALGAHFLTRALTRPATVRAMSAWARVWQANQINRLGAGGPAQKNIQSLQFVSRRFAAEIGLQFGLGADRVRQLADSLSGNAPATANPDANANNGQ